LLSSNKNPNPYISEYGITYSVEELKSELYNLIRNSDLTDDFSSLDYPYFEDLILNLYHKWNEETRPISLSNGIFPVPLLSPKPRR
jgi:hypothetical protein